MKAILFAVASLFVVTASITPSEARTYHHGVTRSHGAASHRSPVLRSAHRGRGSYDSHYARASHYGTRHYAGRSYSVRHYASRSYASRHSASRSQPSRHYASASRGTRAHYASPSHSTRSHYASRSPSTRAHYASRSSATRTAHAGVGGKPARWCGWWMRTQKGGGPELNLAANWKHWGRASGPQVGAVVVWSHHVGMITGRTAGGDWIVKSGNDGGAVRERPRSVAGAVFRVG